MLIASAPTPNEILSQKCHDSLNRYAQFKLQNPNAIALVRVGDFFEVYGDDAVVISEALENVLTSKESGSLDIGRVKMTGIPYPSFARSWAQLQAQGYQVAVVDAIAPTTLAGMKLPAMKPVVYKKASEVLGVQITSTKQLKKYFPSYDFRCKRSWVNLAIALADRG